MCCSPFVCVYTLFVPRRDAVQVARRKLALEDAAKAKKDEFVAGLQADLNEGGGYRKTPLVVEDYDTEQREMLQGLEVCWPCLQQQLNKQTNKQKTLRFLLSFTGSFIFGILYEVVRCLSLAPPSQRSYC